MRLLIAYGSLGKLFHLEEFSKELKRQKITVKLIKDTDYSNGFPSRNIFDWFNGDKKFKKLIKEFHPDAIFTDRQSHFALHSIKTGIPTFILLRGHYWQEYFWGMKTLGTDLQTRVVIWLRNRISEKVFSKATAILPICRYLEVVVKEYYPNQKTGVFLEGINSTNWFKVEKMELKNPCIGLIQDANWWGKTKELLILERVLEKIPDVNFYWAGDGRYREEITRRLERFENFRWLGRLDYPNDVRKLLQTIDIYALITGMDLAPLTLKEAQLMGKPVIATDVGGNREMMRDGETGFLVREGEPDDIIEKINELLENKMMAKEMGLKGKNYVKDKFNWEKVVRNFLDVIKPFIK